MGRRVTAGMLPTDADDDDEAPSMAPRMMITTFPTP